MKKITKADLIYAYLFSIKYFVPNSITTMNFVASHTCTVWFLFSNSNYKGHRSMQGVL